MSEGEERFKQRECVRCGDSYGSYLVLLRDDITEIIEHERTEDEWNLNQDGNDGFCKPCRMAVTDYGAYLTESEIEKLEPKTDSRLDEIGGDRNGMA